MTIKFKILMACIVACMLVACDKPENLPPLEISQLHIMEMPPGQGVAAAYMILKNNTDKTLVLNYVHSPVAADVEVHRVIYDQGVMQMRQVHHLKIDPGANMQFKPGGYHLMLMGIDEPLKVGDKFDITLEFEAGYKIVGRAEVRSPH